MALAAAGLLLLGWYLWARLSPLAVLPPAIQETKPPPVTVGEQPPPELTAGGKEKFYYRQLTPTEQWAYNDILEQIQSFPEKVPIPKMDESALSNVFNALLYDNPMLLHLSRVSTLLTVGEYCYFKPSYRMDPKTYQAACGAVSEAIAQLLAGMPADATPVQQELYLHDQIIRRCQYSATGEEGESTVYGALVEGKASCEGYAKAMLLLLDQMGMESYVVTGQARNSAGEVADHMWNKVRIDGDWYHLDVTWDDPVTDTAHQTLRRLYFNLSDADIAYSHTGFDRTDPCRATKNNFFVAEGLYFSKLTNEAETAMAAALRDAVDAGDNFLEVRFSDAENYRKAVRSLIQLERIYLVLGMANGGSQRHISSHTMSYAENTDLFVLRILPEVD
jgi:hypothetical protein